MKDYVSRLFFIPHPYESIELFKGCLSMNNLKDSISFQVNHSFLKCVISYFKCRFSIKNHGFDIISIVHEFIKSDSTFVSRSATDRTDSSGLWVFSSSYGNNTFFDKIIPHLTSNLSRNHFIF